MKQGQGILYSKLTMPGISQAYERARLTCILKEISCKKLALVIAGAGYGKTTLVAQTIPALGMQGVWYSLDELDQDFATFFQYLVAGIRNWYPAFGHGVEKRLPLSSLSPRIRSTLLHDLLVDLETTLDDPMVVVLDDYHLVKDSPEISRALEFLLGRMPSLLHLVLISRKDPALRVSRHRALGEVIDIGEADLAFRMEEIEALGRTVCRAEIPETKAQELFRETGGWAAALVLYFNALNTPSIAEAPLDSLHPPRPKEHIFQYLEENLFETQPERIKDFMLRTSLLSRLDPEFCDAILRSRASREILEYLSRNHLLTFPYGERSRCFRYHHLLQDFLKAKLHRILEKHEICSLQHEIGKLMEKRGEIRGALMHYAEGDHFEEICRILGGLVTQDLIECSPNFLSQIFERIPRDLLSQDPKLLYLEAKLASLKGRVRGAVKGFHAALERFRSEGDAIGVMGCLKDLGFHHYLTGDILRAKQQMEVLRGSPHPDPFFGAEVDGYLILFSSILGLMQEADSIYEEAIGNMANDESEKGHRFVRAWLDLCYSNRLQNSGDFQQADLLNRKLLQEFKEMGMEPFLPLAGFQAALSSYYTGRSEEGYAHAQEGINIANGIGIHDHQYAWLLYSRGLNRLGVGDLDLALVDARESFAIFKGQNNAWGQASVYELLANAYRMGGRRNEAEAAARKGLYIIKPLGLKVTRAALALTLAEILVDRGAVTEALQLLGQHQPEIKLSRFHHFRSLLLHSIMHLDKGGTEDAVAHMKAGLKIAEGNRYDAWVLQALPKAAPILVECHARGIGRAYIERLLREGPPLAWEILHSLRRKKKDAMRGKVEGLVARLPRMVPAPLHIRCLGPFRLKVGEVEIPAARWRNAKAARLFKYMAIRRDQGFIPKEVLLELAWPEEEAEVTNRRFHVAMTFLRRLLEPDLKRGDPSAYILRQNQGYRLEIGEGGSIDFVEFLKAVTSAEGLERQDLQQALSRYMEAESLYGGTLLEEDPYEDWLMGDREMLKSKYLETLSRIIQILEGQEAWVQCVGYAEKYLSIDRYAEPVYRVLMRLHARLGNTSGVVRTFERCKLCITEDLELPLSESTIALYQKLTKKKAQ